jgi:Tol biopolymer transport system component
MIWIMNRDGSSHRLLFSPGWDPSWSPDGERILFATYIAGIPQLASINLEGNDFRQLTDLPLLRGRSDWSSDGKWIVTYAGKAWEREIILIDADNLSVRQVSPPGGNSQGPSFSPDGQWIAFTSYFGSIGNVHGCEINVMRIDGSELRQLTQNSYCDWQPRWGP